jgi:hypothetical protein
VRQRELTPRRITYVAVDANGSSVGERELPDELSFFPQPEAAEDPVWYEPYDSCGSRMPAARDELADAA